MILFLARHGESTWNAESRYQGRKDPQLSERGVAQAKALASRLQPEKLDSIVSSPLQRSLETAQICAVALGLRVRIAADLTEISHGEWEGELLADVAQRWPRMLAQWRNAPAGVRFPGGESLHDVNARFAAFLTVAHNYGQRVLAVTHDVIIRLAMLSALNKSLASFNEVCTDNAALSEFELDDGTLSAIDLNASEYLGALRGSAVPQAL